ncbi:hypothetical protein [Methanosarcina sp. UBA5]|uniref:hypothetical protein n=1 Tax=Methanosarcina sp. UBA5 TaxID=1915593 RepID=UPI0025EAFC92|nr:hypothetical protein [Methanosarcina sp. UBA5]
MNFTHNELHTFDSFEVYIIQILKVHYSDEQGVSMETHCIFLILGFKYIKDHAGYVC